MRLAVVRNLGSPRTVADVEEFEQEIVDQYALAMAAAGLSDGHVSNTRSAITDFARSLPGPLWSASCDHADRYLAELRQAVRSAITCADYCLTRVGPRKLPLAPPAYCARIYLAGL
jgi:integrase/recombinase XerC